MDQSAESSATRPAENKSGMGRMIAYAVGNLPSGIVMGVMNAWLMYYFCPPAEAGRKPFLAPALFGLLLFLLNIPSAIADPVVGHLSDATRSKLGRRIPYVLWGTPILAISFVAMWFPPVAGESMANAVWLVATVFVFYISFTAVVNPYLAIMPEVWTEQKERMTVSSLMAATGGIATMLSFAAGMLIQGLSAGIAVFGFTLNGYTFTAVLGGVATLIFTAPVLLWIREKPHSANKEVPYSILRSGWQTLKNPAFVPYIISVSLIATSTNLIIAMMPYQVKVMAGSGEGMSGALLAGLIVLGMALFPVVIKVSEKYPRRKLYTWSALMIAIVLPFMYFVGKIPGLPPLIHLGILMVLIAPTVAVFLVVPRTLLADVMDHDEKLTGYRREAMYNGMEGLITKMASGLAPLVMGSLFSAFGNTTINPLGIQLCPIAASVMALGAFGAFLFYPLKK